MLSLAGYLPFLALGLLLSTPCGVVLRRKITAWKGRDNAVVAALSDIVLIGILVASLIFLLGGTYNPFIYFRF